MRDIFFVILIGSSGADSRIGLLTKRALSDWSGLRGHIWRLSFSVQKYSKAALAPLRHIRFVPIGDIAPLV
jgi:hypothetical protein